MGVTSQLFGLGAWLGLSAAATPGPLQAYLLAQSARNGAARTLPVAGVPLVTDPLLVVSVLVLLARLPDGLLRSIGAGGGLVALWLGAGTLRATQAARDGAKGPGEGRTPPAGFVRALCINLTNANAWIFWATVAGPTLAGAWGEGPPHALAFLAGFYLCLVGGNATLVLVAARLARSGPAAARALGAVSGGALVLFGGWQLAKALLGA